MMQRRSFLLSLKGLASSLVLLQGFSVPMQCVVGVKLKTEGGEVDEVEQGVDARFEGEQVGGSGVGEDGSGGGEQLQEAAVGTITTQPDHAPAAGANEITVKLYKNGGPHEGWEAPVHIGPEPLALALPADGDKISKRYQEQGFAFFRPATLPPFAASVTSVAALAALDNKEMEKHAKTIDWEKYVLEEIVEKGKLGSERVKDGKPNPASRLWNGLSKEMKDGHPAWQLPAMSEENQVCQRHDHRGGANANGLIKLTTMVADARARSTANDSPEKEGDGARKKVVPIVHSDVSLYGLPDKTAQFLYKYAGVLSEDRGTAFAKGAFPNLSYGGVYPALGYYFQLMAVPFAADDESTVFEKLMKNAEVKHLATDVCGLQPEDIKAVAARRLWADPGYIVGSASKMVLDTVWIYGYMVGLGVAADPEKVCGEVGEAKCPNLPAVFIKKIIEILSAHEVPEKFMPTSAEVEELVKYFEGTFIGAVTRDQAGKLQLAERSPARKWGCFWARLRLADAFTLWMNLTPPVPTQDQEQSAAKFLEQAQAIKNPLAAIDPFSLPPGNTDAWQAQSLTNHKDTQDMRMQVRPRMYYGEVLYFNTSVVLHTAMHDSNKALLGFGDARTSIESRVVVLERCYREPEQKSVQTIREVCYGSGAEQE